MIEKYLNQLYVETNGCVRFVKRSNQRDYVSIFKSGKGCFAHLGRYVNYGRHEMSLDSACVHEGTIKHEALHNLGFEHTHSRRDRDNYVRILYQNVIKGYEDAFHKYDTHNELVPYDFWSVMHYNPSAFSSNGRRTIESKVSRVNNFGGEDINKSDIEMIKKLYKCN